MSVKMRRTDLQDTDPAVHAMPVRGYRAMDAATKFQLINDMWRLARELSLAGIRGRKPEASAADIERELAVLFLGPDLAAQVRDLHRSSGS